MGDRVRKTSVVVLWDDDKHFGFIRNDDDNARDYYVHHTDIKMKGFRKLEVGQEVQFIPFTNRRGPAAAEVEPVDSDAVVVISDLDETIVRIQEAFSQAECLEISEALAQ